jgi:O-antigen/teichoic acid export membrane protein
VIVYLAYNVDKVLIGKFWGTEALGIYGRAYQLINLPTENLNTTLGSVAFPVFSRMQDDPERLRRYFLKAYSLFLTLVMPITMGCALFSVDIVRVLLGAKWSEASGVFQLMAPTIIAFALVNPLAWLMLAMGNAVRSLKIALMIAPVAILGYSLGLNHGPHGVAAGFSLAMLVLVIPVIWWAKYGSRITGKDIVQTVMMPFVSVLVGALAAWMASGWVDRLQPVFLRLVVENVILFGTYFLVLLFVMKQKAVYLELLRDTGLWKSRGPK